MQIVIKQLILGYDLFDPRDRAYDATASIDGYAAECEAAFIDHVEDNYPDADVRVEQRIEYHTRGGNFRGGYPYVTVIGNEEDHDSNTNFVRHLECSLADLELVIYERESWYKLADTPATEDDDQDD